MGEHKAQASRDDKASHAVSRRRRDWRHENV